MCGAGFAGGDVTSAALRVFFAIVGGVALVGFVVGTSSTEVPETTPTTGAPAAVDGVAPARSYLELRTSPRGDGSGWNEDLAALRKAGPQPLDPVELSGTSKAEDLEARAARRAYDGAPPRIPHAIRQDSAPECLTCHEAGLRFRGLLATPMSHTRLTNCTQCHVVDAAPMPGGETLPPDPRVVANTFDGLDSPTAGTRAWSIAPPQIPHRTAMREQCDSCHGVNGRNALRSTHPSRASCEQCHAASAETNLRPGLP